MNAVDSSLAGLLVGESRSDPAQCTIALEFRGLAFYCINASITPVLSSDMHAKGNLVKWLSGAPTIAQANFGVD